MKNEREDRLKANHFSSWSRPMKVISDVLISRNWYKTVSNSYENLYIYEMSYKNSGFKHVHTQSENDNIPEKPDILIIFLL